MNEKLDVDRASVEAAMARIYSKLALDLVGHVSSGGDGSIVRTIHGSVVNEYDCIVRGDKCDSGSAKEEGAKAVFDAFVDVLEKDDDAGRNALREFYSGSAMKIAFADAMRSIFRRHCHDIIRPYPHPGMPDCSEQPLADGIVGW